MFMDAECLDRCNWTQAPPSFGFDIASSALSNPPTSSPSTNPSTRPRNGMTLQAAALLHLLSRLAVHSSSSTTASSTPIVGRLSTPSPTAPPSSAERRCPRRTAPPSSEGGNLTFRLAANTSSISFEDATTLLARHTSWSCRCHRSSHLMGLITLSPIVSYGAADVSMCQHQPRALSLHLPFPSMFS